MKIDSDEKLDRLFAAARSAASDTSNQEQYFEVRVMAMISERQENRNSWPVLAWRMVPVFAAIVAILSILSMVIKPERSKDYFAAITNYHEEYLAQNF